MKIKKYALGAVFTPMEWNMGLSSEPQQAQGVTQKQSTPSKEGLDYAKEIFEITNKSGLYSDRTMLAAEAGRLIDVLNSDAPDSVKQKMLIQLQMHANDVTNNYALWKTAAEKVSKEDLGSDIAMNSRGNIYVVDSETNNITTKSLSDIKEDSDKYHILTWNELLDSRNNYGKMAFDMESIQSVSSAIGMKEIMEQVTDIISKIGKSETKGYTAKINNTVQQGLEYLFAPMQTSNGISFATPDGLYEFKKTDSNAAQSIDAAINYIYTHLTDGAKHVVKANAFKMGFKSPNQLIELAIVENISSARELDYVNPEDFSGKKSSSKSGNSSSGKDDLTDKIGYGQALISGMGRAVDIRYRLRGQNDEYSIKGINNFLKNGKGENLTGLITLQEAFDALQENGVAMDRNEMIFGGTPVDANKANSVIVDASKGVNTVEVPVNYNGVVDLSLIENLQKAKSEIISGGYENNAQKKAEIYYNYLIPTDANGNPRTARYFTLEAKISSDENAIPEYENDGSIEVLNSEQRKKFFNDVNYVNQFRDKDHQIDVNKGVLWNRDVLSSTIFIPAVINQIEQGLQDDRLRTNKTMSSDYQQLQETYVDPTYFNGKYTPSASGLTTNFSDI